MDLLRLQAAEQDRAAERAQLDLIARARHAVDGQAPASRGVVARTVAALRAALPHRNPCPQPPCPDLEPRARPAYDR